MDATCSLHGCMESCSQTPATASRPQRARPAKSRRAVDGCKAAAVLLAAGLAVCAISGPLAFVVYGSARWLETSDLTLRWRSPHPGLRDRVALRALVPVPKPVGGPPLKRRYHHLAKPYTPDGARRPTGPMRPLPLNKTVTATLEGGIQPFGRGGLRGRYNQEIQQHLEEVAELRRAHGTINATLFWDWENVNLHRRYKSRRPKTRESMNSVLSWFAGVTDAVVTRVEAVEFTKYKTTPQEQYGDGKLDWLLMLRQMGGVVHRAWPKMTDAADTILMERIGMTLEEMQRTGEKRVLGILSGDKGFLPILEYAQSLGVTAVRFTRDGQGNYYPGGKDFSIPLRIPMWGALKRDIMDYRFEDHLRPDEEWGPEHGYPRHSAGRVALVPSPEEELDRRILHHFIPDAAVLPSKWDGSYVRAGLRLNDTLVKKLERALEPGEVVGQKPLTEQEKQAVQDALAELREPGAMDRATVLWNLETNRLLSHGPVAHEMLGRIVRWFEGKLGMPVERVEVAKFVEPWEKLGAYAHDWLYQMDKLGMVIHRVWPPKNEAANMALVHSASLMARLEREKAATGTEQPGQATRRIVCMVSEDAFFDHGLRAAQRAGVHVVWLGKKREEGYFYPAGTDVRIPIMSLDWDTAMGELAECRSNPFVEGAATPDAPVAMSRLWPTLQYDYGQPEAAFGGIDVPLDTTWGSSDTLSLDKSELESVRAFA
eukprot:TRINITY_DN112159_c0_g1_i1.p1 TRINITY_DN112159_c0_g1~~TRINITY_DN112159_c0_g1_i1.p1  ORF type:complete len:712 (-),score=149.71 TRINITY_DN112159_c0_g1_i1:110-2245(-)